MNCIQKRVAVCVFLAVARGAYGLEISCNGTAPAGTIVEIAGVRCLDSGFIVQVFANPTNPIQIAPCCLFYSASDGFQDTLQLTFTSGPAGLASGYFEPCLSAYAVPPIGGDQAAAKFGTVSVLASLDSATCHSTANNPANQIAFTFGTPRKFDLTLTSAVANRFGGLAASSLFGFRVFDSAGNEITSATSFTLSDVPEPRESLLIFAGLVCCAVVGGRRSRRCN